MKATLITAVALFGSVALAQPRHASNRRHAHAGLHEKRAIVWVTETDIVTEIIDITSTVWVDGDATILPSVAPSSTTATTTDARFYTATTPTPETAKPSSTFVSVYVAPSVAATSSSIYVAPVVPTSSTSVYVAPVVPTTTTEPVVASVAAAVVTTTSSAKAAVSTTAASTGSSSSSYTGTCSSTSTCDGDITFYDTGLGACGWDNDGTTENVVALPAGLMGSQSNGNPYCGMTITISKNGKTTTAKVVDKCPGCSGYAIDLSIKAFTELADESVGRTEAVWWFN